MNITDKLDYLMAKNNMNKNILSKETGIPYTTIDGFYKKGTDNIKLSTLKKLAEYFNLTLDEIADDSIDIIKRNDKVNHSIHEHVDRYYLDESTSNYAEMLKENNDMKQLFDAARDVSTEDLKIVVEMVKRLRKTNEWFIFGGI